MAVTLVLRWYLAKEKSKVQTFEIQSAVQLENEKVDVEEIVDLSAVGGLLVFNPGFKYAL
jgi:hypothetical protein